MGCNITGWSMNEASSTVWVSSTQDNVLTLYGSGFSTSCGVNLSASGYSFSEIAIGGGSTSTTLYINFACTAVSKRAPRSGDVQVGLTNPDCSTTCTQQTFAVPAPPPPPPNPRP